MRNIVEALLKLSGGSAIATTIDDISREANTIRHVVLENLKALEERGVLTVINDNLVIIHDRISLALHGIRHGLDIEKVARYLDWRDFEQFSALCFEANEYDVLRNVVFTYNNRRYEIDIVAFKKPRIVCIDCKHWGLRKGKRSQLKKASIVHKERVMAFGEVIKHNPRKYGLSSWRYAFLYPIIVTLHEEPISMCEGLPIVPY